MYGLELSVMRLWAPICKNIMWILADITGSLAPFYLDCCSCVGGYGTSVTVTLHTMEHKSCSYLVGGPVECPLRDTKMATLGVSTLLRNEFSRRLSQLLECPACHNYMVEDIYQCVNGDSICSSCKKTMAKCPKCSGDFVDTRCVFAEKIAQEIYYPCKNAQTGCQEMLLMKDRTYHELNCLYRLYSCIKGNKCEWKGTLTNLIKHIEESHKFDSTEDITAKFWNYTTTVDSVHELSVFTQGELFLCVRVFKSDSNKHLFYVTHVGIKENSDKFRYDLSLYTPDVNKQTISLTNITIPNIAEDIDIYESGQGVVLDDFMVRRLVVGDKLRYKFAIRSNEKQA
uniref:RING-type E3 ubiquitin transferase n=1 Tax=Timema poppense TaxID=170557 RepID=A0A7R9D893_TIMPO|nr:unnamed protein product [Timema poppensis]